MDTALRLPQTPDSSLDKALLAPVNAFASTL